MIRRVGSSPRAVCDHVLHKSHTGGLFVVHVPDHDAGAIAIAHHQFVGFANAQFLQAGKVMKPSDCRLGLHHDPQLVGSIEDLRRRGTTLAPHEVEATFLRDFHNAARHLPAFWKRQRIWFRALIMRTFEEIRLPFR